MLMIGMRTWSELMLLLIIDVMPTKHSNYIRLSQSGETNLVVLLAAADSSLLPKKNVIVIDLTWLHVISRDCIYMGQWYAFFTRCFFLPAAPSCQRQVLEVSETNLQERNFKKQTCQLWIQQSTSHLCIWFLSSDLIEKWPVRFLGLIQQETHVRMPWKNCSKKRS